MTAPPSAVRDYVEDTGTLTALVGLKAHADYFGAFFDKFEVVSAEPLYRVAEDWYVFAEVRRHCGGEERLGSWPVRRIPHCRVPCPSQRRKVHRPYRARHRPGVNPSLRRWPNDDPLTSVHLPAELPDLIGQRLRAQPAPEALIELDVDPNWPGIKMSGCSSRRTSTVMYGHQLGECGGVDVVCRHPTVHLARAGHLLPRQVLALAERADRSGRPGPMTAVQALLKL